MQRQGKGSQVPGLRLMDGGWCATDWPEQWQSVTSQDACPYLNLLEAIWACTWGRARGGACSFGRCHSDLHPEYGTIYNGQYSV